MNILDLDFTLKTYLALKRAGIDSLEELEQLTEEDILKIRNINIRRLEEIKEKVKIKTK